MPNQQKIEKEKKGKNPQREEKKIFLQCPRIFTVWSIAEFSESHICLFELENSNCSKSVFLYPYFF